ncbi:MAG: bifunctional oligoribonuclease/PAP phosphatase NrnA [Armatimonadetes bacterium]|nr:bifunctional oligoribonuclease/PAP phosphatase NrnA [Armatimonadota bacterium]
MSGDLKSQSEISALLPAFLHEVRSAEGVIVGTHLNPDGDAIGAALATSLVLDQLGVEHDVLCSDPPPYYLKFLPGIERIRQEPKSERHGLAIILDLEAASRLGSVAPYFEPCPRTVVIDHHVPHEALGDLRIVCVKSPATCSILLDLFAESEIDITPEIANCLLAGILTDTGNFRYPNTDAHALHSAGLLLERGADLSSITREVYMQRERPALDLAAQAVMRIQTAVDGRLAWTTLPMAVFEEVGANEQHSEGIVNELLSIKGVSIAAVLRESKSGKIRGSLRSLGKYDVAAAARPFGGGGHVNAAGVSFSGSLEDAEAQLIEALKRCLESC